ncbi:integrase / recombinase [Thermoplasma volcanium GSS1]|uniref:Integrase / recombinase n=1 Tax=Thermoplasma volcanium (strain ATCC 51530 / DSM 4299 / JCM 9571 / NBRC 15438 / GSS1) TaxID=273116 RepID=Q97AT2_THEVO|nr:site-specific integrase [Thermoplasma volcanium]BAB59869.1 integrase / recombinase [Thermoplasma volcanium GSS1]
MVKIKDETDLPDHITYDEYQSLINEIINNLYNHYLNSKIIPYLKARDVLLVNCMWELGGRISDILNIEVKDIDFMNKLVILKVKKGGGFINKIPVSDNLLLAFSNFMRELNVSNRRLFKMDRQTAWKKIKGYGNKIGLNLHPHMFRHGLAIYLLLKGVPIQVIARRLGHKNAMTILQYHVVITPYMEREALRGVLL